MADTDFKLMHEILKDIQKRSISMEAHMEALQSEMREGIASIKNVQAEMYKDRAFLESRLTQAEIDITRIKSALALTSTEKN